MMIRRLNRVQNGEQKITLTRTVISERRFEIRIRIRVLVVYLLLCNSVQERERERKRGLGVLSAVQRRANDDDGDKDGHCGGAIAMHSRVCESVPVRLCL